MSDRDRDRAAIGCMVWGGFVVGAVVLVLAALVTALL